MSSARGAVTPFLITRRYSENSNIVFLRLDLPRVRSPSLNMSLELPYSVYPMKNCLHQSWARAESTTTSH